MCTYIVEKAPIAGSGKGPAGWFAVDQVNVTYDHPLHLAAEHALNLDFVSGGGGPGARVAVEMTAESAWQLVAAIEAALQRAAEEGV